MSRHAFIGSGQYGAKWLGEYNPEWDDFRRSMVATVEMSMFGFSMVSFLFNKIFYEFYIERANNLRQAAMCAATQAHSMPNYAQIGLKPDPCLP